MPGLSKIKLLRNLFLGIGAVVFLHLQTHAQLRMHGTVYSESLVRATAKVQGVTEWVEIYSSTPKKIKNDGLVYYATKYEVPWGMEKGIDYAIRFTDGLVEKMIYVSGVIPEKIKPKQKFTIDIDLVEFYESDMTLIVFWSMVSDSFKALPLSKLSVVIEEADPRFQWPNTEMNLSFKTY